MPSELTIEYTVYIWQEGHQFVAHALPLDVMSSGLTPEAARQALDEAVRVFLLTLKDMDTTPEILQECGHYIPYPKGKNYNFSLIANRGA